uniref:Prolyl endopeptidase n=1 Tax=Angiostrongylus cantonensis TaxID=6313 RepID=A0A158P8L1_ANGCA
MLFLLLIIPLACSPATIIPRKLLFSDPKYSIFSLSPNGRFLGYIAPDNNGVKNVFLRCISCNYTRQVTFEERDDVLGKENLSYEYQERFHDVYSFDLMTDSLTLILKNNRFPMFVVDNDLDIRLAAQEQPDGSLMYFRPVKFDKSNEHMYWLWSDDTSDLGALVKFPFDVPENREVLYTATRAQISTILFHPTDKTLLAITEAEFLFNNRPELKAYKLNNQIGFDFKTRDNMVLQAYLSLPPEISLRRPQDVPIADRGYAELGMLPIKPQKLIVNVHGGPKTRDSYGFSPMNAWLTNRGYAVLQVNFRGSTGFGKRLTNAGDGEWSRKMHFDILDSVDFAIAKGITNRSSVAIIGGSYGGYETLAALTFTPDVFACGVDIVGPSNLVTLIQTVPPYWKGYHMELVRMLGDDIVSEEGRQSLAARSPLFFADRVKKPLMILQGANDPRVKQQESDQFVEALKKNNIPVSYILYPDEGHGFRKVIFYSIPLLTLTLSVLLEKVLCC